VLTLAPWAALPHIDSIDKLPKKPKAITIANENAVILVSVNAAGLSKWNFEICQTFK